MSARSKRLDRSLGDSWGVAEYDAESDGGASIHSGSDFGSEPETELDLHDTAPVATRLSHRVTRASSKEPYSTPLKTSGSHSAARHRQSPRITPRSQFASPQSTPGSGSLEPSFVMPSIYKTPEGFQTGSPLRKSESRIRKSLLRSDRESSAPRTTSSGVSSRRERLKYNMDPNPRDSIETPQKSPKVRSRTPVLERRPREARPNLFTSLFAYVWGVVTYAADLLQPLLGAVFAVFIAWFLLKVISLYLTNTVSTALAPICILPGSSYLPFCGVREMKQSERTTPMFDDISQIESSFADIVAASRNAYSLPYTMKKAEADVRDLRTRVKFSKLRSKAELENEISGFIDTAKQASSDLTKYNNKIGNTIDRVKNVNSWTQQVLQGLEEKEAGTGLLKLIPINLNPFSIVYAPTPTLHRKIYNQYVAHIAESKKHISGLIAQATPLLAILNNMDDRLDIIAEIAQRDYADVSRNREELLTKLWSILGGNSASKKGYNEQLHTLDQVVKYKKQAVLHVSGTLLKLQEISSQLENLRDAVAAPEALGWRDNVPLSYHMETVKKSVARLQEVRGEYNQIENTARDRQMNPDAARSFEIDGGQTITATKRHWE
ncbi:hypothetical protein B0J11DRAFT_515171 [Dendryphion nanum]|uniref:Uncharacterized protein n=1 Tax=Dendryphion nanum TaxID=256645 RepID=A0A9P9EFT2_9PLEO|nr:hypothetical protein B0J11DRAFT_515171 [Dendryphion nanum]